MLDSLFLAAGIPLSWIFHVSIMISAVIVLAYIFLGGLTSAIYNEVLQFFLIVAGFLPLVWIGLKHVGGWNGIKMALGPTYTHSWRGMEHASTNPLGVEWFSLVMGLGFVLSFGYWCTDFLVIQRAMAADSEESARKVPLIAAIPKMFFPFLVILPGLIAISVPTVQDHLTGEATTVSRAAPRSNTSAAIAQTTVPKGDVHAVRSEGRGLIPVKVNAITGTPLVDEDGKPVLNYDLAIPNMLLRYFPTGILGLGLTALLASFMSGMAGNVTAFNTVWTYDIYQSYIRKHESDAHYLWMGRAATVGGILLSIGAAYTVTNFNNIMDALQMVFAFVNAPLFATFLAGMFWKRATGHAAFSGLLAGVLAGLAHIGLTLPAGEGVSVKGGWLGVVHHYPSEMAQNFWTAIWAFVVCMIVTLVVSMLTRPREERELVGLVYSLTPKPDERKLPWWKRPVTLAVVVLAMAVALNLIFA
jgi:SSS family solute:Na+ symporter